MAAGTISSRPRRRANDRHCEQAQLRKYFRDRILRYSRNAAASERESTVEASIEAGEPRISALNRPEVKSCGLATFLPLSIEAMAETAAREFYGGVHDAAPSPDCARSGSSFLKFAITATS
jgi:hypothetical protein